MKRPTISDWLNTIERLEDLEILVAILKSDRLSLKRQVYRLKKLNVKNNSLNS